MADPNAAVEAVRAQALSKWKPGMKYAIANDARTYARGKKPAVLLAIVTPKGSLVLAVDMTDWLDRTEMVATMLLEFVGVPAAPPAIDRAKEAMKSVKK